MEILVTQTDNIDEFMKSDTFNTFNEQCKQYYNDVYNECSFNLTPNQKQIFDDWWNGKSLWQLNKETFRHEWKIEYLRYPEVDKYFANSAILEAVSMGCG